MNNRDRDVPLEIDMLRQRLKSINNDELAQQPGMVYQVWNDGEITLTKSGRLLGQRGLHMIRPGMELAIDPTLFPHQSTKYGFCYTTEGGCNLVRTLIRQYGK